MATPEKARRFKVRTPLFVLFIGCFSADCAPLPLSETKTPAFCIVIFVYYPKAKKQLII
jgi:hypothetical protein